MSDRIVNQENPWEWIVAILVGVVVTLMCVVQQVQPLTIVIRVGIAACCAAVVAKITAASMRQLAEGKSK